jgi:hypothetical protein
MEGIIMENVKTNAEFRATPKKPPRKLRVDQYRGRAYLPVDERIYWFRYDHPNWTIQTNIAYVSDDGRFVIVKASLMDEQGRVYATAHKGRSADDGSDFVEKAETAAIGRALSLLGYSTAVYMMMISNKTKRPPQEPVADDHSLAEEGGE